MSKKDKLLRKLFAIPVPKGFAWDDLVTVMTRAGFTNECDGGSHYTFEHEDGFRFTMSKTHPSGLLKPYQVKAAKEAIKRINAEQE